MIDYNDNSPNGRAVDEDKEGACFSIAYPKSLKLGWNFYIS